MNGSTGNTSASAATSPRFIDNGDGTVTDAAAGLMWSKDTLHGGERVTFAEAEKTCAALTLGDHADWRLATVEELFCLADRSRYSPAIDTAFFPDTASGYYWSSTGDASVPSYAWIVVFYYGSCDILHRGNSLARVRAVRSVPAGQ
ncbi:DUF1566 domain-containing protein [Lysobacter sp. 5GHs7-4]|uniref:Lcl C-terminal domain-containing protein n=1 Tax=Lysobacter sp. 5GHs7-4 TaxID=2904253 RepID=UPI001E312242|nr:DUF1566 domain-containing protein [Lysobacter sp. 5GHs7-4]UHQ21921.1 DUF1566 domain-containing protein [Lysobacter sp. 5GHs7-4]